MTTQLLAPAPFAQFQTLGASYTADAKGVIAAAAIDDVADLIRGGCTLLPAYHNLFATTDPGASNDHSQDYSSARAGSIPLPRASGRVCPQRPAPRAGRSMESPRRAAPSLRTS